MKSWLGSYYRTPNAEPVEATILAQDKKFSIGVSSESGIHTVLNWELREIEVVFDNVLQATRITHRADHNSRIVINGKEPLAFIQEIQAEHSKPWHKKSKSKEWGRNLLLFLGIAGVLTLIYLLIVPWLAEKMASTVSVQTEERFGDAVYDALYLSGQEDAESTAVLNEFFDEMKVPTAYAIRISVVKGETVNAFALPGGHIVVYTGLLKQLKTYPELAALLSHEFTHVNNKHATRSIFRQLGSRIFLSLLFGRFGSVTSIMVDQADKLKSLKYSRSLEKEADMDGLAVLKERKIDPAGFVSLFHHLKAASPGGVPEFLGSHPDIDSRIVYINEASANTMTEENIRLKSIFDKLNKSTEP